MNHSSFKKIDVINLQDVLIIYICIIQYRCIDLGKNTGFLKVSTRRCSVLTTAVI